MQGWGLGDGREEGEWSEAAIAKKRTDLGVEGY